MAVSRREGGGRGRPAREPELLPPSADYAAWRDERTPQLERLLSQLETDERTETKYFAALHAEQRAHEAGLDVAPPRLPPRAGLLGLLRLAPVMLGAELDTPLREYGSAYQVWIEIASLVLRDVDIGAIVRRLHPERLERSRNASADIQRTQDADLVQQARKRLDATTRDAMRGFWLRYVAVAELPD